MNNYKWLFTLADSLANMDLPKQDQLRLSKSVRECAENWEAERADHVILRRTLNAIHDTAREEADAAAQRDADRVASAASGDRYVIREAYDLFYIRDRHARQYVGTYTVRIDAAMRCAKLNAIARKGAP